MDRSDGGIPDYEARCSPSSLSFTYRVPGEDSRTTRDLDIRSFLADGPPQLLIGWATFQTLCGIESILKSIDARLAALGRASDEARSLAASMPGPEEILSLMRGLGAQAPRAAPITQKPDR